MNADGAGTAHGLATRKGDFGRLVVDYDAREVHMDGAPVNLTRIEFDLLAELSQNPRFVKSPTQLLGSIWDSAWYGDAHSVEVHLSRLRRKLGESGSNPGYIRTVRGVGYKFEPAAYPMTPN